MEKGTECEQDGIDLINMVEFKQYQKNEERKTNDFISGECDIDTGELEDEIIDVKCPWSKHTFPAAPSDIDAKDYKLQAVGYMWLWNRSKASIRYCLVDTPVHLRQYDPHDIHEVSHIEPPLRITKIEFHRDKSIEEEIKKKVIKAREFAKIYRKEIIDKTILK